MPIETIKKPYEFLARWKGGVYQGMHVVFEEVTLVDGVEITRQPGSAMNAQQAAEADFPFSDVLAQLQADALVRVSELEAEVAAKDRAAVEAAEAHAAVVAAKDANMQEALAALDALNAKALEAEALVANLREQVIQASNARAEQAEADAAKLSALEGELEALKNPPTSEVE
jgi:hypothetical protein